MPRIPLSEIPNVPQLPGAPPVAPYGQVPGAKFATQPYVRGHVEPMRTIANFEQYAKDLQQAPLPGGFAQGQELIVSAAGRYASVAGQAESAWASSISKSLNAVGSIITDAATSANQSKDAVDAIRFQSDTSNAMPAFQNDMLQRGIPEEQWPEYWQKEGAPRYLAHVQNLGTSPKTRAILDAKAQAFVSSQTVDLTLNVSKKIHKDNVEFLTATASEALEKGDAATARNAINELRAQNYINDATYKLDMAKTDKVEHQQTIDFVRSRNPQELKDQAIAAREGKATNEFKFLNDDPALATKTLSEANTEINTRQQEALTSITNKVLKRDVKMTDEDIASEARAAGLDEKEVKTLQSYNKTDVVYNDRLVADANAAVASYDPLNDTDPKTKLPTMTRYKQILDQINTTVPKEMRGPLMNELNKAYREGMSGKPKDGREKEVSFVLDRLKLYRDEGILIDPKTGKPLPSGLPEKKGEKLSPEDTAKIAAADKEYLKVQSQLQEWARNNPQFEPGQFVDKLNELTSVHKEAAAKTEANYKEQKAFEDKVLRAAPVRVPGTPARPGMPGGPARTGAPPQAEMEQKLNAPPPAPPKTPTERTRVPGTPPPPTPSTTTPAPSSMGQIRETPATREAFVSTGPRSEMTATAYIPGMGGQEGGPGVASRSGKAFTMEAYERGEAPYVSVAMDEKSDWQGKYVVMANHPGVVFKVEDTGKAFEGKGESAIDIAFEDKAKATSFKETGTVKVISEQEAKQIVGEVAKVRTGGRPARTDLVASISNVVNPGARNQMMEGTMNVAGTQYAYRSGGGGRGSLPPGTYVVTEHRPSRDTPGMTVGDVGFSFALSDKYDRRVGGTRTLLRIHPDGGTAGTAGCIGIVGGKEVQAQFRDDLTAEIRRAGGKLRLTVG
jgi:hypothetical protein